MKNARSKACDIPPKVKRAVPKSKRSKACDIPPKIKRAVPKSKRSKACDIPPKIKRAVLERDGWLCVVCFRPGIPNAHYIPRSLGGLGIEQNIVTLCHECHREYDQGSRRKEYGEIIRTHLDKHYPDYPDEKRIFCRWVKQ